MAQHFCGKFDRNQSWRLRLEALETRVLPSFITAPIYQNIVWSTSFRFCLRKGAIPMPNDVEDRSRKQSSEPLEQVVADKLPIRIIHGAKAELAFQLPMSR